MKTLEVGAFYKHYKGFIIRVLAEAYHTEREEALVIYMHLADGAIWARPKKMFSESIKINGKKIERFKKIKQRILVKPNKKK